MATRIMVHKDKIPALVCDLWTLIGDVWLKTRPVMSASYAATHVWVNLDRGQVKALKKEITEQDIQARYK
jgi:hypothetical protein